MASDGVWRPSSFTDQRWGRWGNKVKRPLILQISPGMASLRQADVLIPVFLLLTRGQGSKQRKVSLAARQKGRILWGRPLCVIIITKATERKSKEQFQHGVRTDFSLQQLHLQELTFCETEKRATSTSRAMILAYQSPPAWISRLVAAAVIKRPS